MIAIRLRQAIQAYRQRTGEYLTYKKLAQRTGLSVSTLDSIMSSTKPYNASLRTINILCHALRCTPVELLEFHWDTESPSQTKSITDKSSMSMCNTLQCDPSDTFIPSEWILPIEAARLHGVHSSSISRLLQAGRLTTRVIDGRTFIRRADILALPPPRRVHSRQKAPDKSEP